MRVFLSAYLNLPVPQTRSYTVFGNTLLCDAVFVVPVLEYI